MLDLKQFCGTDFGREYLHQPFSRDGFTYATNGHIMVRVTLRSDVPDVDKKFKQKAPLEGVDTATFFRPALELPPIPTEMGECTLCEGRGFDHDCPHCECVCEMCKGEGVLDVEKNMSTSINSHIYALNYIRQILSLPNVEIATPENGEKPLLFRFDGGIGALMPLRRERAEHIDIKSVVAA